MRRSVYVAFFHGTSLLPSFWSHKVQTKRKKRTDQKLTHSNKTSDTFLIPQSTVTTVSLQQKENV